MTSRDATGSDDSDPDDREWNDPPGVDVYGEESGRDETDDDSKGALNVATEGESFVREGGQREPITPGDVSLEGALFVVLGVAVTLFTAVQFVI